MPRTLEYDEYRKRNVVVKNEMQNESWRLGSKRFPNNPLSEGRWEHDKFYEMEANPSSRNRFNPPTTRGRDTVIVSFKGLAQSVTTRDLKELLKDLQIGNVVVHYDEEGRHLGLADVYVDQRQTAEDIVNSLRGYALDGRELKMHIIDNSRMDEKPALVSARISRTRNDPIGKREQLIRRERSLPRYRIQSPPRFRARTPPRYRARSPLRYRSRSPPRYRRRSPSPMRPSRETRGWHDRKLPTTEELDRELEQYMRKAPKVVNEENKQEDNKPLTATEKLDRELEEYMKKTDKKLTAIEELDRELEEYMKKDNPNTKPISMEE